MRFCKRPSNTFQGYTLVWPSVSFGNVGQLGCDLVVNTLLHFKFQDINNAGYLCSENVFPFVGNDAFSKIPCGQLSLSFEAYEIPESKILLIQQRAAVIPGKTKQFYEEVENWIRDSNFSRIVVLTGVDAMLRNDQFISSSSQIYVLANIKEENLKQFGQLQNMLDHQKDIYANLRGYGITKRLVEFGSKHSIPVISFWRFCAEGDNVPDALYMAIAVLQYLFPTLKQNSIQLPSSWSKIHGNISDQSLFA